MDTGRIAEVASLGGRTFESDVVIAGADPVLATPWPVGEVAGVALAQAGDAAARLARRAGGDPGPVRTDVGDAAAATIGFALMRVDGASMARTNAENPWVGRYRCGDGRWIHLHGGFPALADRLASLLELPADADESTIAAAVTGWESSAVEDAVAERRGCAAIIRTDDEWRGHPQGELVHSWPTIEQRTAEVDADGRWAPSPTRPLDGLRVLDMTRVLAGPTCARTLAAFGADVLHVRGPNVPVVPAFVIDTGHGKRQAHVEFTDPGQLAALRRVALDADVVVQGYRPGVVGRYGLDEASLRADGFGGLFASVSAFGREGPWSDRAGWEQLAQSTSGLCLDPLGDHKPAMLPCAFTDYTTGFVMAAGIMDALDASLADGVAKRVDASLCQTAAWMLRVGRLGGVETPAVFVPTLRRSETGFGVVEHLGPCVDVDGLDVGWTRPTTPLGDGTLRW
ncbi:MAG TPA: CoA transferase [Ilumatobacteraceae bacterium]|nr:CoA transferase [Ilumatobacteraceae bacterium]